MQFNNTDLIYVQLKDYYKKMILMGVFKNGEPLPSIRDVALENRVNPNTVAKAFSLLKDEGFADSLPKKGYFVKSENELGRKDKLESLINDILRLGYSIEEIEEIVKEKKSKL